MENGDALLALVEETVRFLGDTKAIDYLREPLPSPTDETLAKIVGRFRVAEAEQRETFQSRLSHEQRSLFGIFGHRAATLGVREASKQWLLTGLIGAVIANYIIPEKRRVEVALAVYHHCARKLGVNTVDLFEEAAEYASPSFAERLVAFGRRSDVTLSKYGWRELNTPEGVQYKYSWG